MALAALVAGCAGSPTPPPARERSAAAAPSPTVDPAVYVAVGASETVGVGAADPRRDAWPQVLHDRALPTSRLVNVGVSGATVRGALDAQLPRALAAEPDVVTVWLVVNDIVAAVPVAAYERQLQRLVHRLRRGGQTEVLVGNVPDLWRLPAFRACLPGAGVTEVPCLLPFVPSEAEVQQTVRDFNAAVRRVVRAEGARLVDLSAEDDLAGLTGTDGFHPSTEGHQEIAHAYARVLRH